jgi:glycosyltransferase involved in cell wall biosynthesis
LESTIYAAAVRPSSDPSDGQRLGVYVDYRFRRSTAGVSAERAFALFVLALQPYVGSLTLIGRLDPSTEPYPYLLPDSVEFVPLPFYPSLAKPAEAGRALLRGAFKAWRSLDGLDVIWALGPNPLSIVFAVAGLLRGKRVVLGVRQDTRAYVRHRHPTRRALWIAAGVMHVLFKLLGRRCPLAVVGADLERQFPGARDLRAFHVSLVGETEVRTEDPPGREPFARRVLTVGRLDAEKNPLLLVDVMTLLNGDEEAASWRLDVYGEGPLERELAQHIAAARLEDAIRLHGYVAYDAGLREAYDRADAFVHVSLTEGMPQVLIEACAARLPIVATDVGGVAALVGDAAILVPPRDAERIADALRKVAADEGLRTRLVAAGTAVARAHTREAEASQLAAFLLGSGR